MKPKPDSEALRTGLPPVVPAAPVDMEDVDGPEVEAGFFSPTNLGILGIMIALVVFLAIKFTPAELWYIAKAGLGLSFIIFIHELGHFLAAKWCDVNVTTFSIGFGPAIPGCRFKWGETTYKLAVLPLGGYVQMVGQVDGDESSDGSEDDPRSFRKKTVPQRMLIISAGVIMNAIFAAVCFIAVYQGSGKLHPAPVIGGVDSGAAAFKAGLRTDAKIVKFGDNDDPTFTTLTQTVITSRKGDKIPIAYQLPGHEVVKTEIAALASDAGSSQPRRPVIGVQQPWKPQLALKGDPKQGPYFVGTPAAAAKFEYGDLIVAMTDPDQQGKNFDPKIISDLPDDRNYPGHDQRDYSEFMRRLQLLAGKDLIVRVRRGTGAQVKDIDIEVAPMFRFDLGVRMKMGPILAVRDGSEAADKNKIRAADPKANLEADKILAVSVKDADGMVIEYSEKDKTLDPERLPTQLRQWSDRLDKAKSQGERTVTILVRRHQKDAPNQFAEEKVDLKWDTGWRFDRVVPLSQKAGMPIPELGFAYEIKTVVDDKTRADSPLEAGDVITHVRAETEDSKEDNKSSWGDALEEGQWAYISRYLSLPVKFKKLEVKIKRAGEEKEIEVPIAVDATWPIAERGWILAEDKRRVEASDSAHAVLLGLKDTYDYMTGIFLQIRGVVTGDISVKNFGGPFTIAKGAYIFASFDLSEFLWFLGLISINLAVVNFLPIPILDGGHMVFLIYEGIRRKPASEMVRVVATYIGLAMIASLMLFVLYLDVTRWFL